MQETCASEDAGDMLSESAMSEHANGARGSQFTCFTSTEVQMLTPEELSADILSESAMSEHANEKAAAGARFTCFTSTKVQILTLEALQHLQQTFSRNQACQSR
jgi:hypothetical protein